MNEQIHPEIRAALDFILSDDDQFAARLLFAARERRARRLCLVRLGAAASAAAIAGGVGALAAGWLADAAPAHALCGVGLLLLGCLFAAMAESDAVRDKKALAAEI